MTMGDVGERGTTESFSVDFDQRGSLTQIQLGGAYIPLAVPCTTYDLDGEPCAVVPVDGQASAFRLTAGDKAGTLTIASGWETTLHFEPDPGCEVKRVGISFFLPLEAVFHLASHRNVGRRIDRAMPRGESFECGLIYNFLLVDLGAAWLRLKTDQRRLYQGRATLVRHEATFSLHYSWTADTVCQLSAFGSMEEAMTDFQAWLESRFGVRRLTDPSRQVPDWVHSVKLVVTVDMMRGNWEISHDYDDALRLVHELKEAGCPPDTLFYVPGWQGAYDSTHPAYWPHAELGGGEAFRALVDAVHECGYHVMIHTTGWGIDPYHPDIDHLQTLALKNADGQYEGWMIGPQETWRRPLKYRTGRIALAGCSSERAFEFDTPALPDRCEAMFTVGGLQGMGGRVRFSKDRRSVRTPPGWFGEHDAFDFPFPLELESGANRIEVTYEGDGETPSWEDAWYCIWYTFIPDSPYQSWTWPILMADMENEEYQDIYVTNVAKVVEEFGIDAVHIDATFFIWPGNPSYPSGRPLIERLEARLPGVPICGEAALAFDGMGFWVFLQGATQSLSWPGRGLLQKAPAEQGSPTMLDGVGDLLSWLDQPSPVCDFVADYCRVYPHLCAANSFVEVGKVCNTFPRRRVPRSSEEHWRVLRGARRLHYIPGIRVNYRDHGLDPETRAAVQEIAGW
jgi:hypothetical protein